MYTCWRLALKADAFTVERISAQGAPTWFVRREPKENKYTKYRKIQIDSYVHFRVNLDQKQNL